jgi:RNA polymerase sigma-70 factor (ECF subfamily)
MVTSRQANVTIHRRRANTLTNGDQSLEAQLKALMVASQAGDAAAQTRLLTRLAGHLRAYFGRRLARSALDVEDLVQEVLLAIHLKRETFDPRFDFTPWVFAIARYKLIDQFRRTGSRPSVSLDDAGELLAAENPEEGAVRRDIASLLARLPPRQQALLRDVKLQGFSMEEAAGRAGISVTAAKVSIHRTMKRLMKEVSNEDL